MPLLYRILMRLAAVAAVLGVVLGIGMAVSMIGPDPEWPLVFVVCLVPAGALYTLAWIAAAA